jgi:ubiquinone/menaquinone biosynthesis C-methylase UbiE
VEYTGKTQGKRCPDNSDNKKQRKKRQPEQRINTMKGTTMKQVNPDNRAWFADWANEYDNTLGKVTRHHKLLELVVKVSGIQRNDRILDIGCGTGLLSLKFLDTTDCTITAIDSSAQMLKIFQEKIETCNLTRKIHCEQQSAEDMDFTSNQFDIIASTVALHHVKFKEPVIKNIYDYLQDGGRFVIGEIDLDTTGKLEDPKRLLRILDYLTKELALAMKDGGIPAFERMYDNGKKHILNDGEYCIGFDQWAELCRNAKFRNVEVYPLKGFKWFKVLAATK